MLSFSAVGYEVNYEQFLKPKHLSRIIDFSELQKKQDALCTTVLCDADILFKELKVSHELLSKNNDLDELDFDRQELFEEQSVYEDSKSTVRTILIPAPDVSYRNSYIFPELDFISSLEEDISDIIQIKSFVDTFQLSNTDHVWKESVIDVLPVRYLGMEIAAIPEARHILRHSLLDLSGKIFISNYPSDIEDELLLQDFENLLDTGMNKGISAMLDCIPPLYRKISDDSLLATKDGLTDALKLYAESDTLNQDSSLFISALSIWIQNFGPCCLNLQSCVQCTDQLLLDHDLAHIHPGSFSAEFTDIVFKLSQLPFKVNTGLVLLNGEHSNDIKDDGMTRSPFIPIRIQPPTKPWCHGDFGNLNKLAVTLGERRMSCFIGGDASVNIHDDRDDSNHVLVESKISKDVLCFFAFESLSRVPLIPISNTALEVEICPRVFKSIADKAESSCTSERNTLDMKAQVETKTVSMLMTTPVPLLPVSASVHEVAPEVVERKLQKNEPFRKLKQDFRRSDGCTHENNNSENLKNLCNTLSRGSENKVDLFVNLLKGELPHDKFSVHEGMKFNQLKANVAEKPEAELQPMEVGKNPCEMIRMSDQTSEALRDRDQETNHASGEELLNNLTILVSENLLNHSCELFLKLSEKYGIKCFDCVLEAPIDFIVDHVTGVCIIDVGMFLVENKSSFKMWLLNLTKQVFKFHTLWVLLVSQSEYCAEVEGVAKLRDTLGEFPITVTLRQCSSADISHGIFSVCRESAVRALKEEDIIVSAYLHQPQLCHHADRFTMAQSKPTNIRLLFYDLYRSNKASTRFVTSLSGEFLQLFPSVNMYLAMSLLSICSIREITSLRAVDVGPICTKLKCKSVKCFLDSFVILLQQYCGTLS